MSTERMPAYEAFELFHDGQAHILRQYVVFELLWVVFEGGAHCRRDDERICLGYEKLVRLGHHDSSMLSEERIILFWSLEVAASTGCFGEEDTAVGDVAFIHQVADAIRDQVGDVEFAAILEWEAFLPIRFFNIAYNLRT